MSDSNRVRVSVGIESTFGTAATTGDVLLVTGQSLQPQISYQSSQILRSDRNVQDLVRMSLAAGGAITGELYFDSDSGTPGTFTPGAFWKLLLSTLRHDSATATAAASDVTSATATNAAKTITKTAAWASFAIGDVVRVRLTAGGALVGYYRITAKPDANTITVNSPVNFTGQTVDVRRAAYIKNGTANNNAVAHSYTIELGRPDITKYEWFTGMTPDTFLLKIADGSFDEFSFGFVGSKLAGVGNSAQIGSPTAAPTATVMNCVDNVATFMVGGVVYAAKEISLQVNNSSAARTQIGALGAQSVRDGACSVTGTVRLYMADHTELSNFINDTNSDLLLVTQDVNGRAYSFSVPVVKWSSADIGTAGMNQDDFITLSFQGKYSANEAATIVISAFAN